MGKWLDTSAKFRATMNWPSATTGQVQKNAPPSVPTPRMNSVKMPVAGEMYENAAANELKKCSLRWRRCSYPNWARSALSSTAPELLVRAVAAIPSDPFRIGLVHWRLSSYCPCDDRVKPCREVAFRLHGRPEPRPAAQRRAGGAD